MKILIFLLLLPLLSYSQGGNTCAQALANPLNIGSTVIDSTCGKTNNFSSSNICFAPNPINALDYIYAITPTSNGTIDVSLSAIIPPIFTTNIMYSILVVYQGCPSLNQCISSNIGFLNSTSSITTTLVFEATAGVTYFINVDGWNPGSSFANCYRYSLTVTMQNIPINTGCSNFSFNNNLSGWYGSIGRAVLNNVGQPIPLYVPQSTTLAAPRVTVNTVFSDFCLPFTVNSPLGGNFVRLGRFSASPNREAARISYRFIVTPGSSVFTYAFLPVLQEPGHLPNEQPFFEAVMFLQNGSILPCSRYIVSAAQGLAGYLDGLCPNSIYRPWSLVSIDLTDYIGQTVTMQFTSGGCSQSAHWGYTYIDYQCSQSPLFNTNLFICEGQCITLPTPANYINYVWLNGGPIVCPTTTTTYNLQAQSQNGCFRNFQIPVNVFDINGNPIYSNY